MTSSEQSRALEAARLRRQAEARVFEGETGTAQSLVEGDLRRLLHELQVHQVELLMQNEELQTARDEVATLLDAYTDLYDHAPVGYLTVERAGTVRKANFRAAGCLGLERGRLVGSPFGQFLAESSRASFADFLERHFNSDAVGACELELLPTAGAAR